ncbi:YrhC family protein [Terribacillus saccharophilus]|uniref:YrhC family protein n=1 Tax=Terribacillus saccharophilus TaxID=361277 RepID=UPI003982CCF4
MEKRQQQLLDRIADYRRFALALLILGSYLYLGSVINVYLAPSDKANILFAMTGGCVVASILIWFAIERWKNQLES